MQWASIKRVERSVEKLTRVYGEDVSRLVDVCRQSVVFESIGSLRHCLDAIHNDPGVLVSSLCASLPATRVCAARRRFARGRADQMMMMMMR